MDQAALERIRYLESRCSSLEKVLSLKGSVRLEKLIDQFVTFANQQVKQILAELQVLEQDPDAIEEIRRLLAYIDSLQIELDKHLYFEPESIDFMNQKYNIQYKQGGVSFMKIISFINLKGGVGKTTVSTNFAYAINSNFEGAKILFIDNDKQGNATSWFEGDTDKGTITNIMLGDTKAKEIIQPTRYPNIDLIAADMGLIDANAAAIKNTEINQAVILRDALQEVADEYQLCIIDNPPDINISVINSLAVTDDVVIVTFPDTDSLDGVFEMAGQITMIRQLNPQLNLKGVLFNAYTSESSVHQAIEEVKKQKLPVFQTKIHYATKNAKNHLNHARREHRSIFEEFPRCLVARDLWNFTKEFMGVNA